mgnify:CR=1 FL=1
MTWSYFDLILILPAFLAGALVLSTHVPLGQEVLKRGIIFIDLAIAQIAALGVIAATVFGGELAIWQIQLFAGLSAIAGIYISASIDPWFFTKNMMDKHIVEVKVTISIANRVVNID